MKNNIKTTLIIFTCFLLHNNINAQETKDIDTDFRPGNGLNIRLNNGDYLFNIGGFLQSNFQYLKEESKSSENKFDIKHSYLSFSGNAVKEKVSFLLQMDFTDGSPLLDAWIAYAPVKYLTITAGQKQTFTNNVEMTFLESNLSMNDRSLLSTTLSNTGREFGLFVESNFSLGQVGFAPKIAVTSGDGRNSFGNGSTDADYGGFKYGGRLDIYPFGTFTGNNDKIGADLAHEQTPKIKLGVAGSYNVGVSNKIGEGHGDFILYNETGKQRFPDYRKFFVDILAKYKGLSILGEYANTSASSLSGIYTASNGTGLLVPGQISSYLVLGNVYNFQAGYVLKNGFALDLRYTKTDPEFKETQSLMKEINAYDATISKYFIDNRLKIQGGFSYWDYKDDNIKNYIQAQLLLQIVF